MDMEIFNKRKNELANASYDVIRRKVSNFCDESNNDEIAGFVKGVVALQSELFGNLERELNR